jgi:stearoyl-CoA desaturase (delta-9 desaturase)
MLIAFLATFILSYLWHIMGVTIGYHRLLAHRSFRCPKLLEYFWVFGGYLAFEGSPIWWATMHRAHHRNTDQELDPHSPRHGWKHAYFGWFFKKRYPAHLDPMLQAKDLVKDPIYRFLEQDGRWKNAHLLNSAIGFSFRGILLLCFGWPIALGSLAAALIVQQVPLLLNVVCHLPKLGYKNYPTNDDSANVWWVALLTAGEGWHNNHHAFPGSARSGFRPFEIDLSWLVIRFMKLFGLVDWMHEESRYSIYEPSLVGATLIETAPAIQRSTSRQKSLSLLK